MVQVKIGAASTWFISSPLYIPDPPPMMPQISKTQALKKKPRRATGKSDDCPVIKLVLCKKKHKVNTKKNQDEASLMTALVLGKEKGG